MRFRSSLLVALAVASFQMAYAPARGQSGSDAVAEFTEKRCQSIGSTAVISYRLDRKALGPEGR